MSSLCSYPEPTSKDDIIRRPYVRPELKINITPTPKHWILTSKNEALDINDDDGYVLSANGEGPESGFFIPCDALSGISVARPGRLRPHLKPQILHRRRVSGIATTSPTLSDPSTPTVSLFYCAHRSIANQSNTVFPLRLSPAPVSVICFLSPPLPPTRTLRNCATTCDRLTFRPSSSHKPSPRTHPRCLWSHLQSRQCCPARLLPRVSYGPCFTSRRALLLALAPRPPPPRYLLRSGPLGGY
jgi:hypothetical protein